MRGIKRKINFTLLLFFVPFILFANIHGIPQSKHAKLQVVTELANIRSGPDIGSPIIHLASQGTTMDLLGQEGPWFHVKITIEDEKTIEGYVHESLVKKVPPTVPLEQEKEIKEEPVKAKKEIPEKEDKVKDKIKTQKTTHETSEKTVLYLPKLSQVHINVSGGANYSLVGDLNQGSQGFIDYYRSDLNAKKTGDFQPLHMNYVFGGEVSVHMGQGLHLGLGADYLRGQKKSSVEFSLPQNFTIQTKPEIKVIPIRVILSYHFIPAFYIKGGIEYIFAHCNYFYKITEKDTWQEWNGKANSGQFGGFLGLGFVHKLSQNLSLFIQASGRYAKIKNLKGEHNQINSSGLEYREKGYMYIYQGEIPKEGTFPLLFISKKTPSGYGVSNPERASLNLTGISLRAGLRVRFNLFK